MKDRYLRTKWVSPTSGMVPVTHLGRGVTCRRVERGRKTLANRARHRMAKRGDDGRTAQGAG